MEPHKRLELIDKLLREKKRVNLKSLNQILSPKGDILTERTFLRDINKLKAILRERFKDVNEELLIKNRYRDSYEYKDGYTAFSNISTNEIKGFANLLSTLENFKHIFIGEQSQALYEKIKAIAIEKEFTNGNKYISWNPVSLIKEGIRNGQEHFDNIMTYIKNCEFIEMSYHPIGREVKTVNCMPVLIKEYNSGWYTGWYLLALPIYENKNHYLLSNEILNVYALDRIEKMNVSKLKPKIKISKDFKPEDYFNYVYGLTRNNLGKNKSITKHNIRIETTKEWIYNYILKYPIHETQNIIKNDEKSKYLRFSLKLEYTIELENYLYKHSSELKVISPKWLKEKIVNRLISTLKEYK